jgi:hypothetical protein
MAIAGIEGLAQGFMQGMALKRQNDRQDVLDAQNLEKFGMDKERFATQQAASAFELQNAQTNAANAAIDRTRALGIQKKGDDFEANLGRIFGAGTPEGELMELEKVHQASGVKGAFARDPKTGGLAKSADGKFQWVNEGGTTESVTLEDSIGRYIAKFDPKAEYARRVKNSDEAASDARKEKTTIAAEERAAKTAATVAATLHSYRMSEKAQELLAAKLARAEAKDAELDAKDITTLFSVPITVTDADGKIKISQQVDQKQVTDYMKWTKKNKVRMTPTTFRDWRAEIPSSGTTDTTASGTDTYDSTSQGKLVAKGLDPEVDAVDVSGIAPVVVEKPSAVKSSTSKPSTPKGLTVPRPSSSSTPVKPTGNAGTMSPTDYVRSIGGAISDAMPVMPPPKQYPKDARFFGNETNPLDNPKRLGSR